jgi:hypothetical protein
MFAKSSLRQADSVGELLTARCGEVQCEKMIILRSDPRLSVTLNLVPSSLISVHPVL